MADVRQSVLKEIGLKHSNGVIHTPQWIAKEMVESLPEDVWNSNTTFLDPACKTGVFLYEIYKKLMVCEDLINKFPDEKDREEHIFKNQLYGLALEQLGWLLAQRVVYGKMNMNGNIKCLDSYTDRYYKGGWNLKEALRKEFNRDMFDVIMGNPPYQEATQSIYQNFIDKAIDLSEEYVCMIVKNNWLISEKLKPVRDKMLNSGLCKIKNYPIAGEVFEGVGVAVSIFMVEKGFESSTQYIEIQGGEYVNEYKADMKKAPIILSNKIEQTILKKLEADLLNGNFGSEVYPAECFRINSNFNVGRGSNTYMMNTSDTEDAEFNVKVAYMEDRTLKYKYVKMNDLPARKEIADNYKIVCGCGLNKGGNVLTNIHGINQMSVCTASWGLLYANADFQMAKNALMYVKSKFFRFLVGLMCEGGMTPLSSYRFELVPLQDFSKPWTDAELYSKYNLTDEEIAYIESTIKPMN